MDLGASIDDDDYSAGGMAFASSKLMANFDDLQQIRQEQKLTFKVIPYSNYPGI